MKFKLYWLTGDEEVVEGNDIADAFSKAGYGAGAIGALDYFQPLEDEDNDMPHDK